MKKLILLCILFHTVAYSQVRQMQLKKANEFYEAKNYPQAALYFMQLLSKDSLDPVINYKTGVCYLHSRSQKVKALPYLRRAVKYENLSLLPETACEDLGDSYLLNGMFDDAITAYRQCRNSNIGKDSTNPKIGWKINLCERCKYLSGEKYLLRFTGDENSQLTLSFQYKEPDNNDEYFKDFYVPTAVAAIHPDTSVKPVNMEATIGTSANAQDLLIYKNENGSCELYISQLIYNTWSVPQRLDKPQNNSGWEEGEYISADNTCMYFTSARKGGFGGKDIYKCERLPNGDWGKAVNLGPTINSAYDEEAPFIHPNGKMLCFSSGRYTGNNGFDIFCSYLESEGWSWPVKTGYPVTTNETGIPSEYAAEAKGKPLLSFTDEKGNLLTVLTGSASGSPEKSPAKMTITVADQLNPENRHDYFVKNRFSFVLPSEGKIKVIYRAEEFFFRTENIDIKRNMIQPATEQARIFYPITAGTIFPFGNLIFENGKKDLDSRSDEEMKLLADLLLSHREISIQLSGYVESPENKKYNARLSEQRTETLAAYLEAKGISRDRLICRSAGKSMIPRKKGFEKDLPVTSEQKIELKIIQHELLTTK